MPLALVEGMAAGCAVVGSAVPGVQEVLRDGVNGRLVAHQDPRSLADALEGLLRDPGLAARLGRQARQDAIDSYSLERMNRDYEELFCSLMQKPPAPSAAAGQPAA
jgi:glycosyltransferase involved in cell wall biosynthesis